MEWTYLVGSLFYAPRHPGWGRTSGADTIAVPGRALLGIRTFNLVGLIEASLRESKAWGQVSVPGRVATGVECTSSMHRVQQRIKAI